MMQTAGTPDIRGRLPPHMHFRISLQGHRLRKELVLRNKDEEFGLYTIFIAAVEQLHKYTYSV